MRTPRRRFVFGIVSEGLQSTILIEVGWISNEFYQILPSFWFNFRCISACHDDVGTQVVDNRRHLDGFWMDCGIMFDRYPLFLESLFIASTAQNCQEPKANERRLLNYKLHVAVYKTRSSATNASNNTGSAVLAPHGALGL